MLTDRFELIRFPCNHGNRNELPHGPQAYVCVKFSSKLKYPTKKGNIELTALSHQCVTLQELEAEVDRLVEELRQIKRQGMAFFEKELAHRFY